MACFASLPGVKERFAAKVEIDEASECHNWRGLLNRQGYGTIGVTVATGRYRNVFTHRLAYELACGEIPAGLQIDHLCRNRACCNPRHLEAVTAAENMARAVAYWRALGPRRLEEHRRGGFIPATHCLRGHEFTDETAAFSRSGRYCRVCSLEAGRRRYKSRDHACGERHGLAKLTEASVREIRQIYASAQQSYTAIADRFGVTKSTVERVVTRQTWAQVP